jgi:hypothetical protein
MVYVLDISVMVIVERHAILTIRDSIFKHVVSELG